MHDTYLSLLAHRYLCGKTFIYGPVMHCTHVYAWNLLTRPETTSHVKWSHLTVVEDHISVTINKHKADQGGESKFTTRAIFANPSDPIQCPFLALFLVLITFSDSSFSEENFLEQEQAYNRWLKRSIDDLSDGEKIMKGVYRKTLGPYSIRKGAMSLCSCTPGGVPPAEVHLRAGHSLGNTHGRYIFGSAGGDEMAGRVLTGGNLHRTSFAALPPHFRNDFVITDEEWISIFPMYDKLKSVCPTFICCLPFLLASGVYHWRFVKEYLKDFKEHSVLLTTFSRLNYADKYLHHVVLGEFECEASNLKATGIPPTSTVLRGVQEIKHEVNEIKLDVSCIKEQLSKMQQQGILSTSSNCSNTEIKSINDNINKLSDIVTAACSTINALTTSNVSGGCGTAKRVYTRQCLRY